MPEIVKKDCIVIHEVLPPEILLMIFKKLAYKSLVIARRTCKQWKHVIDEFKLVEEASCKFIFDNSKTLFGSPNVLYLLYNVVIFCNLLASSGTAWVIIEVLSVPMGPFLDLLKPDRTLWNLMGSFWKLMGSFGTLWDILGPLGIS